MAQEENHETDQLGENWFNSFEDECLEELESEPNMEERVQAEKEYLLQKLWTGFQNSATAVAQLYKDRHHGLSIWIPFQNAASSVTEMYKDSADSYRRCMDLGFQYGRQNRSRDLIAWLRKRRRHIRREDLLAFLCGKNPPQRNRLHISNSRGRQSPKITRPVERSATCLSTPERLQPAADNNLLAFREALTLQGLNGAMSNISVGTVGYRPPANNSPTIGLEHRNSMEDLNSFIFEEISRNLEGRKRSSSSDVLIDSPARKKGRLL